MAASKPVMSSGPIEYTDPDTGKMKVVPLSALSFDDSGKFVIAAPYDTPATLKDWLTYLVDNDVIVPEIGTTRRVAMILKAATPGSSGNTISVKFNVIPNLDPTKSIFDITVSEEDVWKDLTPETVKQILGTESKAGTHPGLVQLLDTETPTLPKKTAAPVSLKITASKPKAAAVLGAESGSGDAFTVEAKAPGDEGEAITVAVSDVKKPTDAPPKFTLTASWKPAQVTGVTLDKVDNEMKKFGSVVKALLPDGGAFSVPKAGTYKLSGGTDDPPTAATAEVDA